jgi:hypothetical protein
MHCPTQTTADCPPSTPHRSTELLPNDAAFNTVRNNINSLGRISRGGQCIASGNEIVSMYTQGLSVAATVGILIGYYVLFLAATFWVVARSAKRKVVV